MTELAILGGPKVRDESFPAYNTIGNEEKESVARVLDSGVLSRYLGAWHDNFMGGPEVQAFEAEWAAAYNATHALAVNSCTSGLMAAVGAVGAGPGDEVIVPPLTMAASATAPMVFNAVPVFADVDPLTLCIDPESVREKITPRTKAIIAVHWFGQPADMDPLMEIAEEHGIAVIEDAAQAPFATYKGRLVGTLGHIGVFSLNYHKHIHTGEGGMVTTNDDDFAERISMIRNHAEAVAAGKGTKNLVNLIGFNFRLGEIESAIGRSQLRKGPELIERRRERVAEFEQRVAGLDGLTMPHVRNETTHAYYTHGMSYDQSATDVPGKALVAAIRAELPGTKLREVEGPLIGFGSVRPLYKLPMYQNLVGYGDQGCPFKCPLYKGTVDYGDGLCPNAEAAHQRLVVHEFIQPSMTSEDLADVETAFRKVYDNLDGLREAIADGRVSA